MGHHSWLATVQTWGRGTYKIQETVFNVGLYVETLAQYSTAISVLPRFSKGQGAISKGHFSAANGPSKGHFSAVNGPSKGHFSAVN